MWKSFYKYLIIAGSSSDSLTKNIKVLDYTMFSTFLDEEMREGVNITGGTTTVVWSDDNSFVIGGNFEEEYPVYRNSGFPYKVRRALKKYVKENNG